MSHADRILLAVLVGVSLIASPVALAATRAAADAVVVVEGPGGRVERPLRDADVVTVAGYRGSVVVELCDGRARVVRADCPDHVCVHTGWITRAGETIACVPNGVVVRIEGRGHDDLDAVVR